MLLILVELLTITSPLNSDGQQFHQYQQHEQSPLNSDGQQFHQYQQHEQSPLKSDGHQFHQYKQLFMFLILVELLTITV
jgi:hypothetical protein